MPSVEMRRTTRVFGARVLRSGRRLFTTQESVKHMRRAPLAAKDAEEDWINLLDGGGDFKENGWHDSNEKSKGIEPDKEINLKEINSFKHLGKKDGDLVRHWGLVYSRKRKRIDCANFDKKFGKKFFRKQSRNKNATEDSLPSVLPTNVTTAESRRILGFKKSQVNAQSLPSRNSAAIQRRRSSLRSRKQTGVGNLNNSVQDGVPFFPIKSNPEISRTIRKASFKEPKGFIQNIDSVSCNASILIIESDRCHREKGAVITMKMSGPNHWFLVVKRNGVERFQVEAQKVIRPCFCNRVTHALIWAGGDGSFKLEFPNRQDWFIFKELYRECSERTIQVSDSSASIIPVPQVNEVSGYSDEEFLPFKMPDFYIRSRGDEVSRILQKSDPVYDMDSDDEEWLNKYNDGSHSRADEEIFVKIVDAFERGIYCRPEDYSNVTKAVEQCMMLASKDILEAVYGYWMAKRKKKHSALVQAFELYKSKKPEQLNFKGVLRKKRSFRRGTQAGRRKQLTFFNENITAKVEETTEAANRAEQAAILKRERAQRLMELADLLTYKASIAVKIAEARSIDDNNTAIDFLFSPVNGWA
ncbi:hypothetical protein R6Q57_013506 [Mikania cordata]